MEEESIKEETPFAQTVDACEYLEWSHANGSKIVLRSALFDVYQLADLANQLRGFSNSPSKDNPLYTK